MKKLLLLSAIVLITAGAFAADMPAGKEYVNSFGMKFVRIEPGTFEMGQPDEPLPKSIRKGRGMFPEGDYDEKPVHSVKIGKAFYVGVVEVTNAQYELFDPAHKALRGKDDGLSKDDDEAVINVNWYQADAFCRWLSHKDSMSYRLPTEAEWEYACRAGTKTNFHTGETLAEEYIKNSGRGGDPEYVPLHVGKTAPNPWGIYDMHGNVEEWCYDFYGPYTAQAQTDPVGYAEGDFKVLRGGSHGTYAYYLRSANRMANLPEDTHWLIGFRVVIGELPGTEPAPAPEAPMHQRKVVQRDPKSVLTGPDADKPYFEGPKRFVKIHRKPDGSKQTGPLWSHHNHNPAIAECANGDLIACWYSCDTEKDRELTVAGTRLVWGASQWQDASPFLDTPDRNDHAPTLWYDDVDQRIYYWYGVAASTTWEPLAMAMRTSDDSGATWSKARVIAAGHGRHHQISEAAFRAKDGTIAVTVDGAKTLWMSKDNGISWYNPGGGLDATHPGVVQLNDGRLLGMRRGDDIDGRMVQGISDDMGKSFKMSPSRFPGIAGGQRLVLMRLRQGPLVLVSFTGRRDDKQYMKIKDASGGMREVTGLFAALSHDDGKTWPNIRLISDDKPDRPGETRNGKKCTIGFTSAEPQGYMAACQGTNGTIHVVSSWNHYAFNLKWLETSPPAEPAN